MKNLIIGFNFFCTILLMLSCLCSPYYAKFDSLYQAVQDHITFDTLCQMLKDSGVVIDTTITDNVLSFIGKHEEAYDVQLRLACATMPYNRILVCVFNVTSVGFEYKQNESCLVTFGKDGEIKDALYLGINDSLPVFVPFNYYGARNVPKDTVPMCKWIYNRSNDLYLTTFEYCYWINNKTRETNIDNYLHTYHYHIASDGTIVKDNDEKYKVYKFNYIDDLENKGMNKELREEYRNRHIPYSVKKKSIFSDI